MDYIYNPVYVEKAAKYIALAKELGAVDAVLFEAPQICWDPRTLLKCMYGCPDWGKAYTCPSRPENPSMEELKDMFSRYKWGIIVHAHDKRSSQKIAFALEGAAFHDNYYFAFSLSDCAICKECAGFKGEPCRNIAMARPAFHSVGIDVFKTVGQLGLPLQTLEHRDVPEQNWYSAVFIE